VGEEPPYHTPVFVLTHHPRSPLAMKGGTMFHFITDGIEAALAKANEVAGTGNICVRGSSTSSTRPSRPCCSATAST